jgi:HK97 family phage major capsid protein
VASWLGQDIGYALSRIIDADLVVGTGSGEPTGMTLLAGAGTNAPITTGGSLIAPTVEKYIDTQYSINDEYRRNAAWLMKDSTAGTIRKLRDGAGGTVGAFLWEPSLTNGIQGGQPDRLLGYPVFVSANVASAGSAAKTIAFGDMAAYYIRTVGNPVIEADSSYGFNTDTTYFRAKWRVDGDLIDTGAVTVLQQAV